MSRTAVHQYSDEELLAQPATSKIVVEVCPSGVRYIEYRDGRPVLIAGQRTEERLIKDFIAAFVNSVEEPK